MGLSASQGRLLLLTGRKTDLEFQAQMVSQQRLSLAQKLASISEDYEDKVNNRQMKISLYALDDNSTITPTNLTYAKLMSGCNNIDSSVSGLNTVDGLNTIDGFACAKAFRLMDVTGAIVVSDISEIPGNITKTTSDTTKSTDATTGFELYNKKDKIVDLVSGTTKTTTKNFFSLDSISNFTNTDLGKKIYNEDSASTCKIVTDGTNYYIKYNGEYYDKTGAKQTLTNTDDIREYQYDDGQGNNEKINVKFKKESVPKSNTTTKSALDESQVVDNKIVINGQAYIIDEALKGNSSEPNYLQDCIRNGKYLIQKFSADLSILGEGWQKITWESASCISDNYYEDDDAPAKAKFDRESALIEAQDKKLQVEQDNIETQHNAVKTEIDSINKIIENNIEKSFNLFG